MGRSRHPRTLGLAAALWLCTLASPVSAQSGQAAELARRQRAHELVELGLRHQRAGDLGSAIGYYREAVAVWSRGVRAYARLAEAYQARGRHEDALAALDAGLSRHPEALRLLLDRARSLEALGRSAEAAAALRRATRGRAESRGAWRARARLAQRRGAWLEALFAWRALLDGPRGQREERSHEEARAAIGALRRLTRGMDPAQLQGSTDDPVLEALREARP